VAVRFDLRSCLAVLTVLGVCCDPPGVESPSADTNIPEDSGARPAAETDADGDGHSDAADCDDTDPAVHPGADEVCNGYDDDCDGLTDDQDDDVADAATWYEDADRDGAGDPDTALSACEQPHGWVGDATDCDDADPAVHPGATEVCNGNDDDCDGLTDGQDDDVVGAATWYEDADHDGLGNPEESMPACGEPHGYVDNDDDCDDSDASVGDCEAEWQALSLALCGTAPEWDASLEDSCQAVAWGDGSYLFCNECVSWCIAEDFCRAQGGHLVVIDDADEDAFVYETLLTIYEYKWWVGLYAPTDEGEFAWIDGTTLDYTNWKSGEPNAENPYEQCVHTWYSGPMVWNNEHCTDGYRFVCES